LDERPHGALAPARGVELDDERLGALALRAVDRESDQAQRDGADHALDVDLRHGRWRSAGRPGPEQRRERQEREPGPHLPSARRLTTSNMRFAASRDVIWPGPS